MHLYNLVGAFILCHLRSGFALMTTPPFCSSLFGESRPKSQLNAAGHSLTPPYAIFTHSKTLTELFMLIGQDVGHSLGLPFCIDSLPCCSADVHPGAIVHYKTSNLETVNRTFSQYLDTRAVHLIRRPSSQLVSAYCYQKDMYPEEMDMEPYKAEEKANVSRKLRRRSLSEGLRLMCEHVMEMIEPIPGMMIGPGMKAMFDIHQLLEQDNRYKNFMEVRFESFTKDYDATTRSVFEHLFGRNDSRIDMLVKKVRAHDLSRHPNPHTSSKACKANATVAVQALFKAGDECIRKFVQMDALMGYGDSLDLQL